MIKQAATLAIYAALYGTEQEAERYKTRYHMALRHFDDRRLEDHAEDMGISKKTLWARRQQHGCAVQEPTRSY